MAWDKNINLTISKIVVVPELEVQLVFAPAARRGPGSGQRGPACAGIPDTTMVDDGYLKYVLLAVVVLFFVYKLLLEGGSSATATAHHILVKDRTTCEELKAELDALPQTSSLRILDKFQLLARAHSTCPSGRGGGSLGTFSPGQMVPAFDKVVFGEEAGALNTVCGPVETQFGFHLILVISRDGEAEKEKDEKEQ